jgi:dihydropyrimidinase
MEVEDTMRFDKLIRGGQVVCPESGVYSADIAIQGGVIAAILKPGQPAEADELIDATGLHVFPGLIDTHVHFNFAEPVAEYSTETIYAAQGGFSTILGYYLGGTSYVGHVAQERPHIEERAHVDYGFHFCAATPEHLEELPVYVRDMGVTSFKYFMNFKGDEGLYLGVPGTDDGYLYSLLKSSTELGDVTVVIHPENIEVVNPMRIAVQLEGGETLRDWGRAKPAITEVEPTVRAMLLAQHLNAKIYIPHLSCADALYEVRRWRERYDRVYVETCPHYLTHTEDSDLGGMGKANPPFRTSSDVEALWQGLADGAIDVVASDHVPRKRATKEVPLWKASQGFPGTATILPVLLDQGYHKRGLSLQRIAQVLTSRPAEIFGLTPRKGRIAVGADADFALVDIDMPRVVRADELGSYSDYSLYDGWELKGWPVRTIVRGETVMQGGQIVGRAGYGEYIGRSAA